MSLQRLIIDAANTTAAQFTSFVDVARGGSSAAIELSKYFKALAGGTKSANLTLKTGAVQATATLTVSSTGSSAAETMTIGNVTFTAKASGATGNEFNVSTTPATQATNMANAFNASSDLSGIVTASASGAVVTLTAVVPGTIGNGLDITESLTNVALSAFASGADGTSYSIDLS